MSDAKESCVYSGASRPVVSSVSLRDFATCGLAANLSQRDNHGSRCCGVRWVEMLRVRDPFSEAVCAIRRRVRAGRYVLGERLAITELALDLELSATPIREALARLAGEGLIEERRGQGYFAWRLDSVDLLELYALQELYLRFSLERSRAGSLSALKMEAWESAEEAFEDIVGWSANAALGRANRLLADRLAAPRLAEPFAFETQVDDLDALRAGRDVDDLLAAVEAYHARRITAAGMIIPVLRSLPQPVADIFPR
ncbi:GntR family transcriptional regulator [Phenylobacterium sp.]|uniref:GntR family transcriptional regulator n=1 Tax=Phenylobacterium sp. TaxID=1871053 RepID=UPI0025FABB5E|nr:GntR family transcriptional regulator [Phenylobacterium sp.]